jgi:hypothetical protein
LETDNNVSDYLLAFETSRFMLGEKGPNIVKRIAKQEFPLHLFIVHLGTAPYKQFRKGIKRMRLEPLEFR